MATKTFEKDRSIVFEREATASEKESVKSGVIRHGMSFYNIDFDNPILDALEKSALWQAHTVDAAGKQIPITISLHDPVGAIREIVDWCTERKCISVADAFSENVRVLFTTAIGAKDAEQMVRRLCIGVGSLNL